MDELTKFDPRTLAVPSVLTMDVEGVGQVSYAKLNMRDMVDIDAEPDEVKKSMLIVHRMMVKAYPDLPQEGEAWDPRCSPSCSRRWWRPRIFGNRNKEVDMAGRVGAIPVRGVPRVQAETVRGTEHARR